jgi:hypothetical protein
MCSKQHVSSLFLNPDVGSCVGLSVSVGQVCRHHALRAPGQMFNFRFVKQPFTRWIEVKGQVGERDGNGRRR